MKNNTLYKHYLYSKDNVLSSVSEKFLCNFKLPKTDFLKIQHILYLSFLFFGVGIFAKESTNLRIAATEFESSTKVVSKEEAKMIGGFISSCMTRINGVTIVSRSNSEMKKILNENKMSQQGLTDGKGLNLGNLFSATKLLTGNVSKIGNTYYINGDIIDSNTSTIDFSEKLKTNTLDDVDEIAEVYCNKFSGWLNNSNSSVNPSKTKDSSENKSIKIELNQYLESFLDSNKKSTQGTANKKSEIDTSQYVDVKSQINKENSPLYLGLNLFPYVGINSEEERKYLNLGIFGSNAKSIEGVDISYVGYQHTTKSTKGIQGTIIGVSRTDGNLIGIQGSVYGYGYINGNLKGIQGNFAGVNHINGNAWSQISLIGLSYSGGESYLQGSVIGVHSSLGDNFFQGSWGGVNYAKKNTWSQVSLVSINYTGMNSYLQISGWGINVSESANFQFNMVGVNYSNLNQDVQLGIFSANIANDNEGTQIGIYNHSRNSENGSQYGLINYSQKKSKLQIGFLNIALDNKIPVLPFINL